MRNRTTIAILALFTVGLIVLSLVLYTHAQQARAEAEQMAAHLQMQEEGARQESARARALNDFLVQMLTEADRDDMASPDVSVIDVLDHAALKLDEVTLDPEIEASLRDTIQRTRERLRDETTEAATPSADSPQVRGSDGLDQTLAGTWLEIDDDGKALTDARGIEVLPSADVMNVHGHPAGTFDRDPGKDHGKYRLVFLSDEPGSNLLVVDDRMPWIPIGRGRWTLQGEILKLNIFGASVSDERFGEPILFARQ
jgi:hypothetical protein